MLNKEDLDRVEKEITNKKTLSQFSVLAYQFAHYIENYTDDTFTTFLKNATLDSLVQTEEDFLEDYETIFYRESFKKEYGNYIIRKHLSMNIKKKIAKLCIQSFYNEIKTFKSPLIQKAVKRLDI